MLPGVHECFGLHTKGISDAIDVVEKANHLGGIVNGTVVKAMTTEHIKISGAHLLRCFGEFFGELTQGPVGGGETSLAPITADVVHKQVGHALIGNPKISDLSTEVMRMRAPSVEAVIHRGCDGSQHLALTTTEG